MPFNFFHTGTPLRSVPVRFFLVFFIVVQRRGAGDRILDRSLGRGASTSAAEPIGFPGGLFDTSLLVKYEYHVIRHLWFGEVVKQSIFELNNI